MRLSKCIVTFLDAFHRVVPIASQTGRHTVHAMVQAMFFQNSRYDLHVVFEMYIIHRPQTELDIHIFLSWFFDSYFVSPRSSSVPGIKLSRSSPMMAATAIPVDPIATTICAASPGSFSSSGSAVGI